MNKCSVLILSYREKDRLYDLVKIILEDKFKNKIEKIIVVTPDKYMILPKSRKILIVNENVRRGKYYAIRLGLKFIKTKIVVMISSDLRVRKNFLQYLLKYFENSKVGLVTGKPMADKNSKIYHYSKIIWDLHHLLCLKDPKGTEICAFRKIFKYFPKVASDEVFIEYKIRKANFSIVYEPRAYGYTRIPSSLIHFFKQRKRCFIGNLFIWKKYGFTTSSVKLGNLLYSLVHYIKSVNDLNKLVKILIVLQLELIARLVGLFEFLFFKNREVIWKRTL